MDCLKTSTALTCVVLAVAVVVACTVYDESMLVDAGPDAASGTGGITGLGGTAGSGGTGGALPGGTGGALPGGTGGALPGGTGGVATGGIGGVATGGTGGNGAAPTGGTTGGDLVVLTCEGTPGGNEGPVTTDLIDDMEDQNDGIIQGGTPPRDGYWYAYRDESGGTMTPSTDSLSPTQISGGRDGSSYAQHATASGFTEYGAGIGVDLNSVGGSRAPYNASGFTGVTFWARGTASGEMIRFTALIPAVVPTTLPNGGGTCTSGCDDAHGVALDLADTWQEFRIPFCALSQGGWGTTVAFAPSSVLSLQFQGAANVDFDIWVDDIAFYSEQ